MWTEIRIILNCVTGKCASRSLLLSYQNKDSGSTNPSFGMTPTTEYNLWRQQYTILQSVSYLKKDWRGPVCQSFFGYDNDKDEPRHAKTSLWIFVVVTPKEDSNVECRPRLWWRKSFFIKFRGQIMCHHFETSQIQLLRALVFHKLLQSWSSKKVLHIFQIGF